MRKIINPFVELDGFECFGCSPKNPIGMHLEFYEDGDSETHQCVPKNF